MNFIDLKAQYQEYKMEIDAAMRAVMDHGRFIMGPEVVELETQLASYVACKYSITVSSGTASLEIALRALGVGPGDEVITTPFTWISSAEVIALVGAKPVFVDIAPQTYNMEPAMLEAAITENTKAIMPVSLFGQIADLERINSIAAKRDIPVIEDAAQSFGATQNGKRSCGLSKIASTSFFPAKPLGCYGDGGALFTDDDDLARNMRSIRVHGGERRHHHTLVGTNGRFDTLQAAVVLVKFKHFDKEVERRGSLGARYSEGLKEVCEIPAVEEGNTHVYGQYTIRVKNRDKVINALKDQEIPSAVYYPKCLHQQPVFEELGYSSGSFPESEKAAEEVLSLPMHPFLTERDQDRVISALKSTSDKIAVC